MKAVRLVSIFSLVLAFVMLACAKHDGKTYKKEQLISYEELHPDARAFITDHFSSYTIDRIKVKPRESNEYYKVYFSGCSLKIEFNRNGEWTEVDGKHTAIPTTFILPAIMDYLNANYPYTGVESIDKKRNGFKVELLNGLDIRFNHQGAFLKIDD